MSVIVADCGGQRSDASLFGVSDYLSPEAVNITFRGCPPAATPTEGVTTYYVTSGILFSLYDRRYMSQKAKF